MKMHLYLVPLIFVAVFLLIRAEFLKRQKIIYVIKPLCTLLVIAVALLSLKNPAHLAPYTTGVLVGLVFSFGGDIALMFQHNRKAFTLGLGLFLLAHVAYTAVFWVLGRFSVLDIVSATLLIAAGLGFYRLIRNNLGTMKGPVIGYIVVISLMVNRAMAAFASPVFRPAQAWMIAMGALLFYISDVILAANRFWRPWRYQRISLAFYYSGQLLIAMAGGAINL